MKKWILAILIVFVLFAAPTLGLVANGDQSGEQLRIDVVAHTDPSGSPPWIKAKWELWLDPNTKALTDVDPSKPGTQGDIVPGGDTYFYTFVIVSDPNGISDLSNGNVYVDVWHPECGWGDGSFKYQVHAWDITPPTDDFGVPMLDTPVFKDYTVKELLDRGVAAGYFNQTQADELLEEIYQNEAKIYVAELKISYHQPYGWYKVVAWATDNSGATSDKFTNYFEVRPMLAWATDFQSVEFNNVKVGVKAVVGGDYDMSTPSKPTIRNLGNTPIQLYAYSSDVVSSTEPPKNFSNVFDMRFLDQIIDPLPSFEWVKFNNMLPPCNTTKIDFSLTLPQGAPASDYTGYILLKFVAFVDPCETPIPISDPVQPTQPVT